MSDRRVVLVTGVSGQWGSRLARRLVADEALRIIGVDGRAPAGEVPGLDFVQAAITNPALVELLKAEAVDTVCHLPAVEGSAAGPPAESAVQGAGKLLTDCAEAGVRRLVLMSSTAVYGAYPDNPAFLSEGRPLRGGRQGGPTGDLVEIERLCRGLGGKPPPLALAVLRFAGIVGPSVDTPMVRFLTNPRAPSLLGFDPMMQLIHEEDVVDALAHAVVRDRAGTFNVAAEGVLPLNKIRGLAGKPPLAVYHGIAYLPAGRRVAGRWRAMEFPVEPDYLRYRWVADLGRMRQELGFGPAYTAEQAVRDMAERRGTPGRLGDEALGARAEQWLRELVERRSRTRGQAGTQEGTA